MSTREKSKGKGTKVAKGAAGELQRKAARRSPERTAHAANPKPKGKSK